jgi:hypothetical protein
VTVPAQEVAPTTERDVVIAVRVPDTFTREELESRFALALESAKTKAQRIQAKPIDLETYDKIKEFLTSVQAGDDLHRKGVIARRSNRSTYWDLYLPDGYNQVEKVELEYKDKSAAGEVRKAELKPVSRAEGEKDPAARLIYLGLAPPQLELRADPNWEVVRYTVHLNAWGDKPAKKVSEQFVGERCYRLEIEGYAGSLQDLFETLGDSERIGVAMVGIQPPKTLALGLADLVGVIATQDGEWYQNNFRVRVTPPAKPQADRAWILFPLSQGEAERLKAALDEAVKSGAQTSLSLSKSLQSGELGGYEVAKSTGNISLRPNDRAQWHEMTNVNPVPGDVPEFGRQFVVEEPGGWSSDPRLKGAWRVIMFERDVRSGGEKTGSSVILPTKLAGAMSDDQPSTHFHVNQVKSWTTGDSPLAQNLPAKPAPKAAPRPAPNP